MYSSQFRKFGWRHSASKALLTLLSGAALTITGCDRNPEHDLTAPTPRPSAARNIALAARQSALTDLARSVALALQDQGLRSRIKNDLHASRFTKEHKLQFASYAKGNGGVLIAKLAKAVGKSDAEVLATLGKAQNVEFYMPVAAHRESWKGDDDLIVATQLSDSATPVGFHLDGTPAVLSLATPPTTPTLVIVPAETNFSTPLDEKVWHNGRDVGGQTIGTYERIAELGTAKQINQLAITKPMMCTCEDCPWQDWCEVIPPPTTVYPPGLYLDYSNIYDWKENWPRGDPEVEVHLIGPTFNPASNGEHLSCTGEHVPGDKNYDQNGHEWSRPQYWEPVKGQLFTAEELARYDATYNKPFVIQFWEDDEASCEIRKDDRSTLEQVSGDLSTIYHAASVIVKLLTLPQEWVFVSSDVQAIRALGHLNVWDNEDEYLGQVVLQADVGRSYPGITHVMFDNSSGGVLHENGRIRLRYVAP